MEREAFFSGYCRQSDGARTVCVVAEDENLTEVDCLYDSCPHADCCPIGKNIRYFVKNYQNN